MLSQALMETEVAGLIGADRHERTLALFPLAETNFIGFVTRSSPWRPTWRPRPHHTKLDLRLAAIAAEDVPLYGTRDTSDFETPCTYASLHHRPQRVLGPPAGLQERREVGPNGPPRDPIERRESPSLHRRA